MWCLNPFLLSAKIREQVRSVINHPLQCTLKTLLKLGAQEEKKQPNSTINAFLENTRSLERRNKLVPSEAVLTELCKLRSKFSSYLQNYFNLKKLRLAWYSKGNKRVESWHNTTFHNFWTLWVPDSSSQRTLLTVLAPFIPTYTKTYTYRP